MKSSINQSIFFALSNSETSGVPVLLIGSAGTGKSTTVSMFAKLRGYELLLLRGSTSSEQEITGFDTVYQDPEEKTTKVVHAKPTWFNQLLENSAAGKKTLLFLDEITAVNPYVQAALLHLIFERKVDDQDIPEDTLIVSAGNYSNNLTGEFELLSPVVNRFAVFNVVPDEGSLDEFLSEFDGVNLGSKVNLLEKKEQELREMDSQRQSLTEEMKNKVNCYFEKAIKETTRSLLKSGEKVLSFSCTATQELYKSQTEDELLKGFISLRSLSYLRRYATATYLNFGKAGIMGSNFKNVIQGLCGIALSRKNHEVVATDVTENYYQSLVQTLASIDKLSNTKAKEYEDFFGRILSDDKKSVLTKEETVAMINKLEELKNDNQMVDLTKPLDDEVIESLLTLIESSSKKQTKIEIKPGEDIATILTPEKTTGIITSWNEVSTLFSGLQDLVLATNRTYPESIVNKMTNTKSKLMEHSMKIGSYAKLTSRKYPEFSELMPEIKNKNFKSTK